MGSKLWSVTAGLLLMWTYYTHATPGNPDPFKSLDSGSTHCECEPVNPPGSDPGVGSVYFATNNEIENWVIVACIQADGRLFLNNTISTRGKGSSSNKQYPFVDYVITGDNYLFVANAGSDSVTMFTINPQYPEKLTFITSVDSQGNFPASLAYSSELKVLCVLNAGLKNNLACFKVTPTDLTPLPNTIKSVGKSAANPPRFDESVSDIIFTANSKQLVVSVRGSDNSNPVHGSIVVFPVLSGGKLLGAPEINKIPHFFPGQLTLIPTTTIENYNNNEQQHIIYSAFNYDSGTNPGLVVFVVHPSGKIDTDSTVDIPIPENSGTAWSKFSPRTGLLYTTDIDNNQLSAIKIYWIEGGSSFSGTVVEQYPSVRDESDLVIASLPTGDFLYTLNDDNINPSIHVYSLGSSPGNVTLIQDYKPRTTTLVAQTGQPLKKFLKGIAAFIAQPYGTRKCPPTTSSPQPLI